MLWKTLLGAAGLYGPDNRKAVVIHSFHPSVKTPPQAHAAVQVFDFEGGFWCNTRFPESASGEPNEWLDETLLTPSKARRLSSIQE